MLYEDPLFLYSIRGTTTKLFISELSQVSALYRFTLNYRSIAGGVIGNDFDYTAELLIILKGADYEIVRLKNLLA